MNKLPRWWALTPVLLRPRVAAILRRSSAVRDLPGTWVKNGLLFTFAFILLFGLLQSTSVALAGLSESLGGREIPLLLPLQLLFSVLAVLLLFSGVVAALSALFFSHDLDLILTSPVPRRVIFFGKLWDIALVSSWFPLLLVSPILVAVADFFQVSPEFYVIGALMLVVLVLCASAGAISLVTLVGWIVTPRRIRLGMVIVGLGTMIGAYLVAPWHVPPEALREDVSVIIGRLLLSYLDQPQPIEFWDYVNPAHLAAGTLAALRNGQHAEFLGYLARYLGVALVLLVLAGVSAIGLLEKVRARHQGPQRLFRIDGRRAQRIVRILMCMARPSTRAIIAKELKLFARDVVQALQLMVLLGLCVVYLYNFQILRVAGEHAQLQDSARLWWEGVLVVLNILVGALVTTTICMRFVFPSISLEGRNIWILQGAPLSGAEILRGKFWCWFIPLAAIMSVVMVSGGFAIQAEPRIIAVSGLVSWIYCYGIVGLAVGLGAVFSNFTWDHPAQVTAGVGAVFYFFASALLIFVAGIPTAFLVVLRTLRSQGGEFGDVQWGVLVVSASTMLVYAHVLAHRWAMRMGSAALERLGDSAIS